MNCLDFLDMFFFDGIVLIFVRRFLILVMEVNLIENLYDVEF